MTSGATFFYIWLDKHEGHKARADARYCILNVFIAFYCLSRVSSCPAFSCSCRKPSICSWVPTEASTTEGLCQTSTRLEMEPSMWHSTWGTFFCYCFYCTGRIKGLFNPGRVRLYSVQSRRLMAIMLIQKPYLRVNMVKPWNKLYWLICKGVPAVSSSCV